MLLVTVFGLPLAGVPQPSAAADGGHGDGRHPARRHARRRAAADRGRERHAVQPPAPDGRRLHRRQRQRRLPGAELHGAGQRRPGSLTFDFSGPLPNGLGAPASASRSTRRPAPAYVNAQTADNTTAGGPGPIVTIPPSTSACTRPATSRPAPTTSGSPARSGPASATQLDKFWNAQITVADDAQRRAGPGHVDGRRRVDDHDHDRRLDDDDRRAARPRRRDGRLHHDDRRTGRPRPRPDDGTTTTEAAVRRRRRLAERHLRGRVDDRLPLTGGSTHRRWSSGPCCLLLFGRAALLLGRPPRVRPAKA